MAFRPVSVRIPHDLMRKLEKEAKSSHITVSQIIRSLIRIHVEKKK